MEIASTAFQPANRAPTANRSVLNTDFNTFIRMLTTQAKFQDPLNPISSTEYASQLAQFSMVEQQVKTNGMLTLLSNQMNMTNMASLAGWVGMEVRAATPMQFDGTPITVSPNPVAIADKVELVVTNEDGDEVQRIKIPVSSDDYVWDGLDKNGDPFPQGKYSFQVESYVDDKVILSEPAEVYGIVTEAQNVDGNILLVLKGGETILSSSVTAIRNPT